MKCWKKDLHELELQLDKPVEETDSHPQRLAMKIFLAIVFLEMLPHSDGKYS